MRLRNLIAMEMLRSYGIIKQFYRQQHAVRYHKSYVFVSGSTLLVICQENPTKSGGIVSKYYVVHLLF